MITRSAIIILCAVILVGCGFATAEPTPTPTPQFGANVVATQTAIANWVETKVESYSDIPTDRSEYALHMLALLSMSGDYDDMYLDDSRYCNDYLFIEAGIPDEEGNLPDMSQENAKCLEVMANELFDRVLLRVRLETMSVPDGAERLHSAMLLYAKAEEESAAAIWRGKPETALEKLEEVDKYFKIVMEEIRRLRPSE